MKKQEEDQQKVQLIMSNKAFTDNPFDILLSHVTNAMSKSSKKKK